MPLDVFEHDIKEFNPNNPYVGDERTPVKFRMDAVKDDAESEKQGRPIFRDTEFIQIFNSKDNVIDRPVRDTDKQRWPRAYAAWKATGVSDAGSVGTRLEHWPQMTRAQVEEFKFFQIHTVEQLAACPDTTVQKLMGAVRLKALAQAYVEAAKGEAPFLRMQAEVDKVKGENAELHAEVRRLTKLVEERLTPAKA